MHFHFYLQRHHEQRHQAVRQQHGQQHLNRRHPPAAPDEQGRHGRHEGHERGKDETPCEGRVHAMVAPIRDDVLQEVGGGPGYLVVGGIVGRFDRLDPRPPGTIVVGVTRNVPSSKFCHYKICTPISYRTSSVVTAKI